jgi:predicted 3-demethylubiquinone-9 3-methyltransferase (glyoxalase superfamily)
MQQKITPNLWFNGNAKEAVDFYSSVFEDAKVNQTAHYPNSAAEGLADFQKDMAGKELDIDFSLGGLRFLAINAGPEFKFNQAVSFAVSCKDQKEVDYYWEKLSSVPEAEQCGWCKDKYGLSWQIVPEKMEELMQRPGAYAHMMQMKKLIIDKF